MLVHVVEKPHNQRYMMVKSEENIARGSTLIFYLAVFCCGFLLGNILFVFTDIHSSFSNFQNKLSILSQDITDEISTTFIHNISTSESTSIQNLLKVAEEENYLQVSQEIRVLCWVMTSPENHRKKAVHVRNTWGRHCSTLLFISEEEDPDLPTIKLDVSSGREGLWSKTVEAFKHVYQHHQEDYDWVLKADDDTYVVVENLRRLVLPYSPHEPVYLGFELKYGSDSYMAGGPGYVLSSEAVKRFSTQNLTGLARWHCPDKGDTGPEDVNMGTCLKELGAHAIDTRDFQGRIRFFPFNVDFNVKTDFGDKRWWFWLQNYWTMYPGILQCSNMPVGFHKIKPLDMYMMETLIYRVQPYGVTHVTKA